MKTSITPGEILLEEYHQQMGISQSAIARAIGVPPRAIKEIVLGKRSITPAMSIRYGAFFGQFDAFWHGSQEECEFRAPPYSDVIRPSLFSFSTGMHLLAFRQFRFSPMSLHHPFHQPYRHLATRLQVGRAVHTLVGLVWGITGQTNERSTKQRACTGSWIEDRGSRMSGRLMLALPIRNVNPPSLTPFRCSKFNLPIFLPTA